MTRTQTPDGPRTSVRRALVSSGLREGRRRHHVSRSVVQHRLSWVRFDRPTSEGWLQALGRVSKRAGIVAVVITAGVIAASCSGSGDGVGVGTERSGTPGTTTVEQAEASPSEDVPSALDSIDQEGLPVPLIERSELLDGGPPPDGIPPIDEPSFHRAGDVDFLADTEPVLAVEVDGEARAYPVQIMIWHEIVNDTFGDLPVTITYCPLCNTAVGFDRRLADGRVLSFGTSGKLFRSSLVMYDRQTESLWAHFDGRALAGVLTGTELERIPVQTVSWGDWSEQHPDGLVLSRDTGVSRDYGRNPYPGYDVVGDEPFLFEGELDDRLPAKERIVGVGLDDDPTAVRLAPLLDRGVITTDLDGRPVVVWARSGTTSALDADTIEEGRDVGATGVFVAEHDGRGLTFRRTAAGFVDDETSSTWTVLGRATDGPLAGTQLEALEHVDTFWFAWAAFSPDTEVLPAE